MSRNVKSVVCIICVININTPVHLYTTLEPAHDVASVMDKHTQLCTDTQTLIPLRSNYSFSPKSKTIYMFLISQFVLFMITL